ncbi:MAG: hypothetical protein ACLQPD_35270 [Desulfomonilaceae bacterium]
MSQPRFFRSRYPGTGFLTELEKTNTEKSKTVLATDYDPVGRLVLICPQGVTEDSDYSPLAQFYDQLLELEPMNVQVIVLVRKKAIGERLKALRENVDCVVQDELLTIWSRDVAGFICSDHIVNPVFRRPYYRGSFDSARQIDRNMEWITEILGKDLIRVPLVWDGSLMDYQLCDDLVVTVGDLCWIIAFAAIYSMPITPECYFQQKTKITGLLLVGRQELARLR